MGVVISLNESMSVVIFEKISKDDVYLILDEPYNMPVVNSEGEEALFFSKWHEAKNAIKRILDQYGTEDGAGNEDYTIADRASLSRGVSIVVQNKDILSRDLFGSIQRCLNALPEKFEIHMCVEDPESIDSDLFIQPGRIRGYVSDSVEELMGE
jgi:hypothetical protein